MCVDLVSGANISIPWQYDLVDYDMHYHSVRLASPNESDMALTTLERSFCSLMLDQELLLIHKPGIATPSLVV